MAKIQTLKNHYYKLPLDEVLVDAKHGNHSHFELIITQVFDQNGEFGTGYTYTGGRGGKTILSMLEEDIKPFVEGMQSEKVENIYNEMQWYLHYVGRGGISSFAISAIDIALWDLRGKKNNQSLLKQKGDIIKGGSIIAIVGNSGGNSTNGLYYQLRRNSKPFNPLKWTKLK